MNGVNKVILVGNLGNDPEPFTSRNGKPYIKLNLATNRWMKKGDKGECVTDWHRVIVWGKQAERCQENLKRGSPVCIEGYLSTFTFEENGQKRYFTSVTADEVNFVQTPKREEGPARQEAGDDASIPF